MAAVLSLPILVPCEKAISGRWQRAALVAGAAMLSLVQARRAVRSAEGDFAGLARTALGIADRRAFLLRHMPPFPLYEEVNRSLPNGARILMSFYCGGFYIDRTTYCTDIVQGSIRMTTWEAFLADVRGLGITHVLAPRVEASPGPVRVADAAGVGFMVQGEEHAFIGRLLADHGQLLAAAGDDGLYVLKDLPATAPRR